MKKYDKPTFEIIQTLDVILASLDKDSGYFEGNEVGSEWNWGGL